VYYINGKYAAEAAGSPYEAALNLSAYPGKTITIKAEAYDSAKKLSCSISQKVKMAP
jgi:hypothetical protein